MTNLPPDWGSYYYTCEFCGEKLHKSEGACDCLENIEDCPCGQNVWTMEFDGLVCLCCFGTPGQVTNEEN